VGINKSVFDDSMEIVTNILNKFDISDKERRINRITKIYNNMLKNNAVDREFYSLAHELKSYEFIRLFWEAKLSNDTKSKPGPDITYGNNQIECVCCSEGEILKAGFKKYSINHSKKKSMVIDYNKKKEFLLPRITSSLKDKRDIIEDYIKRGIIKQNECAIIFISLGELNIEFNAGDYGMNILEVLIGKGCLCITFDRHKEKFVDSYYQHIENIQKNNGKKIIDISANFFNSENINISGIIFSTAPIYEQYDFNNTFLFLNPFAKNQINVKDFNDIIYWQIIENDEYVPMKNTKRIKINTKIW